MTLSPYDQDAAVRRLAEIWAERHEPLIRECTLLTIKQAEQMLSIGRTKVLEIFPVVRLGEKSMRVRLSDIHNYINNQTNT